jgi:hypothetical protein
MGRAARVQIEQLGGHVAYRLGGAAARARPLIGAELVQRRGLGRAAGIAVDQMQRMHRHIHAVAVAVLEHQEFIALIANLHALQADIAADAVGLVHHRRAGLEALQVAQDGRRVGGGGAPAAALLTRPRAPNSCDSLSSSSGGSLSARPAMSSATLIASGASPSANCCQVCTARGRRPCAASISAMTSRRPGESAAISTRPVKLARKLVSGASGCAARASRRKSGGAVVAKSWTPPRRSNSLPAKRSMLTLGRDSSAACSPEGSTKASAGGSSGRSMSWRRSS